ncbi:hypothetical protein AV521_41385 [Streptomyces sp. IMTB 2501]|uniref:SCO2400 family protein n=1 Tax=Streptomyces sp. IMTB 2501 TaxID=1776340 RepID=UPI00096F4EBD|nr:hypothetical protein [Streptomyces sp. IMTB 2501]OLZ62579.1 hypothetical protein AV521_41385 [Streptomyces sp. IMTB 2501]
MDYCSSCRRHLNGALVCPGCGAYAPDIAPPGASAGRPGPSARHTDRGWFPAPMPAPATAAAADGWSGAGEPPAELTTAAADAPSTEPPADVTDAPRATQGRAARRRQLARWKKNQRRAVVATAVALVGGGLTLASMDRGSGDRAQAASAPDNRSMGLTENPSAAPSHPASTPALPAAAHRRTSAAPTAAQTPAADVPHQQTLAAAPQTAQPTHYPHTAAVAAHPTASTAPAAATIPEPRSTTPTAQPTTPSTTGSTGSSGSSASTPAPASASPSQLCLVLVCLGG